MSTFRVLVTGGAGFVGSHLVNSLLKEGHRVVALDNLSTGAIENLPVRRKKGFLFIKGDIRDNNDVRKALNDVDVVFHMAAIIDVPLSVKKPLIVNDVNVSGTLKLLEACLKHDVRRFIYASSCAVYGAPQYLPIDENHPIIPQSPYGISKLTSEHFCRIFHEIHGLETISLRFFNIYGKRQVKGPYSGVITKFAERLKEKKSPVIFGDGEQTRDFLHVNDAVNACMLALRNKTYVGKIINIGSGKETTINELVSLLIELSAKTNIKPVYKPPRKGDILRSWANIEKAKKLLGYQPKVDLESGLIEFF